MKYCVKWQRIWNRYKYTRSKQHHHIVVGAQAYYYSVCYCCCCFSSSPSLLFDVMSIPLWMMLVEYHQKNVYPLLHFGLIMNVVNLKEQMKWTKFIVAIYMRSFEWVRARVKMSTQQNRLQQLKFVCFQHFSEDYIAFKYRIVK